MSNLRFRWGLKNDFPGPADHVKEPPKCPVCDRKSSYFKCLNCGHLSGKTRISKKCPDHPKEFFYNDLVECHNCKAKADENLVELGDEVEMQKMKRQTENVKPNPTPMAKPQIYIEEVEDCLIQLVDKKTQQPVATFEGLHQIPKSKEDLIKLGLKPTTKVLGPHNIQAQQQSMDFVGGTQQTKAMSSATGAKNTRLPYFLPEMVKDCNVQEQKLFASSKGMLKSLRQGSLCPKFQCVMTNVSHPVVEANDSFIPEPAPAATAKPSVPESKEDPIELENKPKLAPSATEVFGETNAHQSIDSVDGTQHQSKSKGIVFATATAARNPRFPHFLQEMVIDGDVQEFCRDPQSMLKNLHLSTLSPKFDCVMTKVSLPEVETSGPLIPEPAAASTKQNLACGQQQKLLASEVPQKPGNQGGMHAFHSNYAEKEHVLKKPDFAGEDKLNDKPLLKKTDFASEPGLVDKPLLKQPDSGNELGLADKPPKQYKVLEYMKKKGVRAGGKQMSSLTKELFQLLHSYGKKGLEVKIEEKFKAAYRIVAKGTNEVILTFEAEGDTKEEAEKAAYDEMFQFCKDQL